MLHGYVIYPCENTFTLQKVATPANPSTSIINDFSSFELAVDKALEMIENSIEIMFSVIVCFNHGLGLKFQNLENVYAKTVTEAKKKAERQANAVLGEDAWLEVKVRPQGVTKSPDSNT